MRSQGLVLHIACMGCSASLSQSRKWATKRNKVGSRSASEAIKALCLQLPELQRFLANAHLRGMEFAVFRGKRNIGEDELGFGGPEVLRNAPVIRGSKREGVLQTIVGIVLIVIGSSCLPWRHISTRLV